MKLINKSVLVVLTALACSGQAVGFPTKVTKLTRDEGDDRITIWNIWDYHFRGSMNKKNAEVVITLANSWDATILLEDPFVAYKGNDQTIKNLLNEEIENRKKRPIFLNYIQQMQSSLKKEIKCVDPRTEFIFLHCIEQELVKKNEYISSLKAAFLKLHDNCAKKIEQESDKKLKTLCENKHNAIQLKKITETINRNLLDRYIFEEALVYCDIAILQKLFKQIKNKKQKNFIICSGERHSKAIDETLLEMGFKQETIPGISLNHPQGSVCLEETENIEINLKKTLKYDLKNAPLSCNRPTKHVLALTPESSKFYNTTIYNNDSIIEKKPEIPHKKLSHLKSIKNQSNIEYLPPSSNYVLAATKLFVKPCFPNLWRWIENKFA